MPAIHILIDTDPADNTTTVDCWTVDDDDSQPIPYEAHWHHVAKDPNGGAVARAMLLTAQAMFTGGQQVQAGPGVPTEVLLTIEPIAAATPPAPVTPAITCQVPA